jgi:Transposase DNA-binding
MLTFASVALCGGKPMTDADDVDDWANDEFGAASLGDARLTQRLVTLARQLSQSPQCSFPQSLDGPELKAAYRFFDNRKVDPDGVLAAHIGQTLGRMQQMPVVLAVQDTTEFNLSHLCATEGMGRGTGNNLRGFMMHSLLAVAPEGLPLGVLGMKTWVRPPDDYGKGRQRRHKPIREKESVKWLEGLEHLAALKTRCPDTHIVAASDRESDVYDVFIAERPTGVDWLVSASWNRSVDHPEKYLWEAIAVAPVLGETQLRLPATGPKGTSCGACAVSAILNARKRSCRASDRSGNISRSSGIAARIALSQATRRTLCHLASLHRAHPKSVPLLRKAQSIA